MYFGSSKQYLQQRVLLLYLVQLLKEQSLVYIWLFVW